MFLIMKERSTGVISTGNTVKVGLLPRGKKGRRSRD